MDMMISRLIFFVAKENRERLEQAKKRFEDYYYYFFFFLTHRNWYRQKKYPLYILYEAQGLWYIVSCSWPIPNEDRNIFNDDESIYLYFTIENFYYVIYDRNEMESLCIRSNTTN